MIILFGVGGSAAYVAEVSTASGCRADHVVAGFCEFYCDVAFWAALRAVVSSELSDSAEAMWEIALNGLT